MKTTRIRSNGKSYDCLQGTPRELYDAVQIGDLVTTKRDLGGGASQKIEGIVREIDSGLLVKSLRLGAEDNPNGFFAYVVSTIETYSELHHDVTGYIAGIRRPVPELPHEAGLYKDADGNVFALRSDGEWFHVPLFLYEGDVLGCSLPAKSIYEDVIPTHMPVEDMRQRLPLTRIRLCAETI